MQSSLSSLRSAVIALSFSFDFVTAKSVLGYSISCLASRKWSPSFRFSVSACARVRTLSYHVRPKDEYLSFSATSSGVLIVTYVLIYLFFVFALQNYLLLYKW